MLRKTCDRGIGLEAVEKPRTLHWLAGCRVQVSAKLIWEQALSWVKARGQCVPFIRHEIVLGRAHKVHKKFARGGVSRYGYTLLRSSSRRKSSWVPNLTSSLPP
jgi:hypothetical protein